ncbi:hypothetical protein CAF53_08745 [Sphingobium sp. LB126]|uniref:hypothetical protein n=1 Tax=Sphingobium sp. LB126 TaxID=1983755 RepID=UPI000C20F775|nr:hypothetical protein [Sphingobium sp. LB126]PJG48317.1 hypothetical protein CAF53_08745 [Sphingobium sp. LB126]
MAEEMFEENVGAQADEQTTARQAAESILAWAKQNHLFAKGPVEDSVEDEPADIELLPQNLFESQAVKAVLKKRAITLVAYSDAERKVTIFTHAKLTKAEREKMPFQVVGGIKLEYALGGTASVKGGAPSPDANYPYFLHNGSIACGSSIHPVNCFGAGTLGALVKGPTGTLFGLTNNHVTGACNCAVPGIPILCPGPLDATEEHISPFTIGRHSKLLPINEGIPENIDVSLNCDAAIFEIEDPAQVSSMQGDKYDTPSIIDAPYGGLTVEKCGRTTGFTTGVIVGVSASPIPVGYSIKEYGINKTVYFDEAWIVAGHNGAPFSRAGDSGSLVVGVWPDGSKRAVGLVFAGNEARGQSFILPLQPIVNQLGVELVYGHNV